MTTDTIVHHACPDCQKKDAMILQLSMSHLGILSQAAIRIELEQMIEPADVLCIDLRKLHELNDILGYSLANRYFGRFARTRMHDEPYMAARPHDLRGQYGGDEVVIACAPGDGMGLLLRMVDALDRLTHELTAEERAAIAAQTGGLVDGFAAVFVLIPNSVDIYHRDWRDGGFVDAGDVQRGIDECGRLKKGHQTGSRATSGRPGTIIGTLEAMR